MGVTFLEGKMLAHRNWHFEERIDFGHSSSPLEKNLTQFHNCAWGTLSWIRTG